jgi:peptide/nickel transport system permease protein
LSFFIVNSLPGNTALQLGGGAATPEQIARLEAEMNLDKSVWWRYGDWLTGILSGDMGNSMASNQPVASMISERFGVTLELGLLAFLIALGFALPLSLLAVRKPSGIFDHLFATLSMISLSLPNYVLAILLVLLFSIHLRVFPSIGFVPMEESIFGNIRSLTLPALSIGLPFYGLYSRLLRNDLMTQITSMDYVTTAVAKGLSEWRILIHHVFPNSLFGLLTLVGLNMGTLISGTVVIEQIFSLPGIGQLLLQGINLRDAELVQALVLIMAVITVLSSMCVDIIYTLLDPRVGFKV